MIAVLSLAVKNFKTDCTLSEWIPRMPVFVSICIFFIFIWSTRQDLTIKVLGFFCPGKALGERVVFHLSPVKVDPENLEH